MPKILKHIKYYGCLVLLMLNFNYLIGQDKIPIAKKILLRDSLDFIDNKIAINTSSNEFSPIPYHGGLLYISNKPIRHQKFKYNKVYWVADSILLNKNNKGTPVKLIEIKLKTNNDFTPQTIKELLDSITNILTINPVLAIPQDSPFFKNTIKEQNITYSSYLRELIKQDLKIDDYGLENKM